MFLVDRGHKGRCWWKNIVHEDEDSLLGAQLDPLPDDVHKLTHSQVGRYQILFLVNVWDVTLLGLLHNDRYSVGVLLPDSGSLSLPFVCRKEPQLSAKLFNTKIS
eukprot:TRINITY_DN8130_c0_g1_i1.p1 TRINITY_DN8130_c0_g1~~TRINITY_DN8130_c0_g1_i1.p1  ORF type:complete len:105 (+),score=6.33 TRINITY_DN8130_c0_g1_i1:466-780(+)